MRRISAIVATLFALTALAGCDIHWPPGITPPGGDVASCTTGTWSVTGEHSFGPMTTPLGNFSFSTSGPGAQITLTDTTWSLTADQTFTAQQVITNLGTFNETVHIVASADGTITKDDTAHTITFTVDHASGTVDFTVTGPMVNEHQSFPIMSSGMKSFVVLNGDGNFNCSGSNLTIMQQSVVINAKK